MSRERVLDDGGRAVRGGAAQRSAKGRAARRCERRGAKCLVRLAAMVIGRVCVIAMMMVMVHAAVTYLNTTPQRDVEWKETSRWTNMRVGETRYAACCLMRCASVQCACDESAMRA